MKDCKHVWTDPYKRRLLHERHCVKCGEKQVLVEVKKWIKQPKDYK
jgi:hypothetical protein